MSLKNFNKIKIIKIIIAVLIIVCLWIAIEWVSFLQTPLVPEGEKSVDFVYLPGKTVKSLAYQLKKSHVLQHPEMFVALAELKGVTLQLKAGEYRIDPGMRPATLINKMAKGEMLIHTFTIVEGWTFKQFIAALNEESALTHTLKGANDSAIMEAIGHTGESPEGRFAPVTFYFSGPTTDVFILKQAYDLMQKKLDELWQKRANDLPFNCPYKALIAASIIEKETSYQPEKPKIAGVIARRLKIGMMLQVDPAVIYGLGDRYNGKLTPEDLTKDSGYNTYLHKDLPPTPIAMPSFDSINAALHPAEGTELYYVAKNDGTGSHEFSKTLGEQNAAIKKSVGATADRP
jgi:UPF0755 protein